MADLGTIERVDLREVWPNEAADFTPWLAANLHNLGEALGLDLELQTSEAAMGSFSLDVLAHDLGSGRPVIIENQPEATNHSHLGQLLTYAAGYDAYAAVWLVRDFRDEHRAALDWLNQRTGEDTAFFGVVVEAIRIDDSRPAPQFRVVVMPNDWSKTAPRKVSPALAVRPSGERYRVYFQSIVDTMREQHNITTHARPSTRSRHDFASGFPGIWLRLALVSQGKARVDVHINGSDQDANKRVFDYLETHQESIEAELGGALVWERLNNNRRSRISAIRDGSIDDAPETLEELQEWMVERLLAFKRVFTPHLRELAAYK